MLATSFKNDNDLTRKASIFLISYLLTISAFGQTMTSIFRQLPPECTPELTIMERYILLKNGDYIIPGGDTIETIKYSIDTLEAKDYLRYEFNFSTGQAGFIAFELKSFRTTDGRRFIIFSRCGGMNRAYDQQDIKIYELKNNILIENSKQKLLPLTINITSFLKKETPDTIKTKIEQSVSGCYDLKPETTNEIEFGIFPQYPLYNDDQWILGYTIVFTWTGSTFDRKIMTEK